MIGTQLSTSRLLIDCCGHQCCNHLQVLGIDLVEGGGVAGIEIQDANQSALTVENGYHYLRLASRIARYMPLEGVHISHNLRRPDESRSAAYSLRESDFQTAYRALIRADSEQVRLDHAIETDPAGPREVLVQNSSDTGHSSYGIGEILQQRSDLSDRSGVPAGLVGRHDVEILAPV